VTIPYANYAKASYLRATAIAEDGREANDMRMLKGPTTTLESVRVDVVQLHVSVVDKASHFVPGLTKDNFSVAEDGRPQKISGFEIVENLPVNIGVVIDSSGSMEKGMPFVRDACAELFRGLMREKDQGFVLEFQGRPKFLQELTTTRSASEGVAGPARRRGDRSL
jgi:VWFA-related protein